MSGAASWSQEPSPVASWPWAAWGRKPDGLTRKPELDSPSFEAYVDYVAGRTWDATSSVYLVPKQDAVQAGSITEAIDLPRMGNTVLRVWWSPIDTSKLSADDASMPKRPGWLKGAEYVMPIVPAADRILTLKQTPQRWSIGLTDAARGRLAAGDGVVVMDIVGGPALPDDGELLNAAPTGEIVLNASMGLVSGTKLQFEPLPHKNTIGYWVDPSDRVRWRFSVGRSGPYRVMMLTGCGGGQGGSDIEVKVGEQKLNWTVIETGHFQNFRWRDLGQVKLEEGQELTLEVGCVRLAKSAVMDIRQIRLIPIESGPQSPPRNVWDAVPDVLLPPLTVGPPAPGQRAVVRSGESADSIAYHTVTLPTDWRPGQRYPLLVEWAGNGPYVNDLGDRSSGRVEDGALAHGLAGGDGWIVLCLPFLNGAATANVTQWWGDAPAYDPGPTQRYAAKAIDEVCEKWGGDRSKLVLVGFSRGSIACNAVGMSSPELASRWRGLVCFSHFAGVRDWPPPNTHKAEAEKLLGLMNHRDYMILEESPAKLPDGDGAGAKEIDRLEETKRFLAGIKSHRLIFGTTGFVNHSDRWALVPSRAREAVRDWLASIIADAERQE